MAFDLANADWGRILSGLGGGLMQAGTPGGNFGQGLMTGVQGYDAGLDRKRQAELDKLKMQATQEQLDAQHLANTKATQDQQRIDALIAQLPQGPMAGGVQTASGPMQPGYDQRAVFQAYPQLAEEYFKNQVIPQKPKERKTTVVAGQLVDAETGETIRDLTDAEIKLRRAGASTTKVDVHTPDRPMIGSIPEDMMVKPDGKGGFSMSVIPGSKTDIANKNRAGGQANTTDIVTDDINRALLKMDQAILPTTGLVGAGLSHIPNTASRDVAGLVQTIKGNIGIDKLQQMRQQSPTGGALGNVTESENATLQSLLGNLEQSQSDDQFRYNLKRVYNKYLDIVHGEGRGPARYDLGPAAPGPSGDSGEIRYDSQGNPVQ